MDVPGHQQPLIITDAAVNIAPDLDAKVDIIQNAIDLAQAMGAPEVRVAILSDGDSDGEGAVHNRAQWARCFFRGELRQARETGETFLRKAEEGGRPTEAGVARRNLGLTCLYQGDLGEARTLLERTLADYAPERDAPARFRYPLDIFIGATIYLALTMWHLGEVDRARRLAERAVDSATELGHVPTSVIVYAFKVLLEIRRDDPAAALRSAEMLLALAREHGLRFYVALGEVCTGWARGRLYPEVGVHELRQALAAYFNQGNKASAPLIHGLLAEFEAKTRSPESALTLIDQGLAISQETGERFSDPYLHRLRGDILLARDAANPAPAEEAFKRAIAAAKEQGARSFELLAALSLAKLYQSAGRPVEAHAVLAPALEGFSPTPEMPEIAEALALMERLA